MNDNSLVVEIVESFVDEMPQVIETMKALYAEGHLQRVAHLAHKKKPSLGYLGIDHGKQLAIDIEEAVIAGNNELIEEKISELQLVCKKACKELREKIKSS